MCLNEMIKLVKEKGYSYEWISEITDIPLDIIDEIFEGKIVPPDYTILNKLNNLFSENHSVIKESATAYFPDKKQGEYTIDDYYRIPEERRAELIDGVIYDLAAARPLHQFICSELGFRFKEYVKSNQGKCMVFTVACDVRLDCDDKTVVLPDIFIVCDKNKLNEEGLDGAPDMVVEVLSPSTRKKDMTIKLKKYNEAGVREYWIVDPKKKRVLVYDFENDDFPILYTFDDEIPVITFEGKCKVNFAEIYKDIQFLYEKE